MPKKPTSPNVTYVGDEFRIDSGIYRVCAVKDEDGRDDVIVKRDRNAE